MGNMVLVPVPTPIFVTSEKKGQCQKMISDYYIYHLRASGIATPQWMMCISAMRNHELFNYKDTKP
jgi:hypothetical protein